MEALPPPQPGESNDDKTHTCLLCSAKLTKHKSSTSGLLNHFKNKHPPRHEEIIQGGRHSKLKVNDDGSKLELYTFQEMLPHHVRFVKWCVVTTKSPVKLSMLDSVPLAVACHFGFPRLHVFKDNCKDRQPSSDGHPLCSTQNDVWVIVVNLLTIY